MNVKPTRSRRGRRNNFTVAGPVTVTRTDGSSEQLPALGRVGLSVAVYGGHGRAVRTYKGARFETGRGRTSAGARRRGRADVEAVAARRRESGLEVCQVCRAYGVPLDDSRLCGRCVDAEIVPAARARRARAIRDGLA